MNTLIAGYAIGDALAEEGLVPKECASVEVLMPADGIFQIRYTINVTPEDLLKLSRCFAKVHEREKANERVGGASDRSDRIVGHADGVSDDAVGQGKPFTEGSAED